MKFYTNIISIVVSLFASVGFCSSTIETGVISLPNSASANSVDYYEHAAWGWSNGNSHFSSHNNTVSTWDYVGKITPNNGVPYYREVFWSFDLGSHGSEVTSFDLEFYTPAIDDSTTLKVEYRFSDKKPFAEGAANDEFDSGDASYLRSGGSLSFSTGDTLTDKNSAGVSNINVSSINNADRYLTIRFRRTHTNDDLGTVNLYRKTGQNASYAAPKLTYDYTPIPELRATSLFVGIIVLGWIVCSRRRAVRTAC